MFNIFENRNYTLGSLIKLGDSLGRSLREDISLFSVDSSNNEVSYLTESNQIITGKYSNKGRVVLTSIKVKDASIYTEDSKFDDFVSGSIETFIQDLRSNDFSNATNNFNSVLGLWEERVRFDKFKVRLFEKSEKLKALTKIKSTPEYSRFTEIKESLVKFLSENKEDLSNIVQIQDNIRLSNLIVKEFNHPKVEVKDLVDLPEYSIFEQSNTSVYDLICRQELIKAELLESKENFDSI